MLVKSTARSFFKAALPFWQQPSLSIQSLLLLLTSKFVKLSLFYFSGLRAAAWQEEGVFGVVCVITLSPARLRLNVYRVS